MPEWLRAQARAFTATFRPRPHLTISEWSDRYRVLSAENAAEPGPWRTDRVPYLREPMDAIGDLETRELVIMKSAQVGATSALVENVVAFYIDQEPSPILVVQPAETDAEDFSKRRLAPMLRDTPSLAGRVAEARSRDSDSTILSKAFPGGSLKIVGATSPKGLRRASARIALLDEVDGYPVSAGPEGDPIALVRRRLMTWWNRKLVLISTPTIKGRSRIEAAYLESDQRRYFVPCPHCGTFQVLTWGTRDSSSGIRWTEAEPDTVYYQCVSGCVIEELDKPGMIARGEWRATNRAAKTPGYHISALYSLFDGASWPLLVREWLDVHRIPERRIAFTNTILAQPYEEQNLEVRAEGLATRRETWPAEIPHGVGVLTMAVDVQGDRLEVAVWGWGADEECWLIHHARIYEDPEGRAAWSQLEALRVRQWRHESGGTFRIWVALVDAGFLTSHVYHYVQPRERAGVWCSHGRDDRVGAPIHRAVAANDLGVRPWTIKTPHYKDLLFRRLKIETPGPGYIHLHGAADDAFIAGFTAEVSELKQRAGQTVRVYRAIARRNEAIDLFVYGLSALHGLYAEHPDLVGALGARGAEWSQAAPPAPDTDAPIEADAELERETYGVDYRDLRRAQRGGLSGGGWATNW